MGKKHIIFSFLLVFGLFVLAACTEKESKSNEDGHGGMNHSGSGEVPQALEKAENPTYPEGTKAVINAAHMPGMDGAVATITGAFDTKVYTISYTPTNGGEKVEDHKWVIHEEIADSEDTDFQIGEEVVIKAEHMPGMDGVIATVDSVEETTVYMVDYEDTETGESITNHKWVTESELSPSNE